MSESSTRLTPASKPVKPKRSESFRIILSAVSSIGNLELRLAFILVVLAFSPFRQGQRGLSILYDIFFYHAPFFKRVPFGEAHQKVIKHDFDVLSADNSSETSVLYILPVGNLPTVYNIIP